MSNAFKKSWRRLTEAAIESENVGAERPIFEQILSQSEIRVLNMFPGAVSIHTENGGLVWCNAAFENLFSVKNVLKADLDFLAPVNPQDHPMVLSHIAKGSGEASTSSAIRVKAKNAPAQTLSVEINCSPYEPEARTIAEKLVIVQASNVTKNVEEKANLEAALEEAETGLASRENFFSAMSHEIRTPLNAIIGFSELLEGKAAIRITDCKRLEYAGLINQSAVHLLDLINDVLDLSKLDADMFQPSFEMIDLEEIVERIRRSFEAINAGRGVDITVHAEDHLPQVQSDARSVLQIVTNLLSNAVKFSNENSEVRVLLKRRRSGIEVSVIDTGLGMDEETLANLGNTFFQAGPSISKDYKGTGLGLSIVYKLVDLLGGKLNVESKLGEGSTFCVFLPLSQQKSVPISSPPAGEIVYLSHKDNLRNDGILPLNQNLG